MTPATPPGSQRCLHGLVLLAACAVLFWWKLGALGLIDPDEPFYAQTAREMLASGDWLTPRIFGAPQFEKPILYYWMTALSFDLFGISELAGRLAPALFATLLVFATWLWAARAFSARAGLLAGLVLASSIETVLMARMMLTDVVLAFFLASALYSYWMAGEHPERRTRWALLYFACAGLAVLTKGPIGSLVPLLAVATWRWRTGRASPMSRAGFWLGLLVHALVALPWFVFMLWRYGWEYFQAFFIHENWERLIRAEHPSNNHWYFYIGLLCVASLPWMPLVALMLRRALSRQPHPARALLWSWLLSNLVLLTIVQSKLPSYGYFLFVPLAILLGETLDELLARGYANRFERWLFLGIGSAQGLAVAAVPLIDADLGGPFLPMLSSAGVLLLVSVALHWTRPRAAGVGAAVAAMALLIVCATTLSREAIEEQISTRGACAKVLAGLKPGESLLSDRFLVRGVHFYTQQPVTVIADTPTPFWTQHDLPILVGQAALDAFLRKNTATWCVLRPREWRSVARSGGFQGETQYFGKKVAARLSPEELRAPEPPTPPGAK